MADIFISYAREDRSRIEPLAKSLEELGWSVFWDRTIPAGKTWRQVIGEALESARSVIVVWSITSVKSRWVQEEGDWGLERNILIPIFIDEIRPPLGFAAIQAVDLVKWDPALSSPEFEKLISDISIILGPSPKHVKETEQAAEKKRKQKQEEEMKRKEEEERKAGEESQRLEIEKRRIAEEKQKRVEAKRKAEDERKRKEAELQAERVRKEQVERKAEPPKPVPTGRIRMEAAKDGAKLAESKPFEKKPDISAPQIKPEAQVATKPSETLPQERVTNSIGMKFVLIPAGSFMMGSRMSSKDLTDRFGGKEEWCKGEKPHHAVKIERPFYLQTTSVTQGQWQRVMGNNPSNFKECGDDCPAEKVSWEDAQKFIKKLNQLEKTKSYRLPSEAEWEYSCRAGSETEFSFGGDAKRLDEFAWFGDNSDGKTHPVGRKKPNAWGLCDMHGNVWQWVEDDWHDSYEKAPDDGSAWTAWWRGPSRVFRGGSWGSDARRCRSATRSYHRSGYRSEFVGFRLSMSVSLGP